MLKMAGRYVLLSAPIGDTQVPSISGLQSSVSTNAQPGASKKVRLLLQLVSRSSRVDTGEWRTGEITYLTSPVPSSLMPPQPSLPLVQADRSPDLKYVLPHTLPPLASPLHLSFSHNSTSFNSEAQWRSSNLSSSIRRVRRFRSGLECMN